MLDKLDEILIDGWRKALQFWSIRLAILWAALNGAVTGFAAFYNGISTWALVFLAANVVGYVTIAVARIYHQPGLDK